MITWTDEEKAAIARYGEICPAMAREAMERNKINFDQVERINNHFENHRWGSNADRKYRQAAITKAIRKVAANPAQYSKEEE